MLYLEKHVFFYCHDVISPERSIVAESLSTSQNDQSRLMEVVGRRSPVVSPLKPWLVVVYNAITIKFVRGLKRENDDPRTTAGAYLFQT